ncbi:MAG TPA: winged helix-turn-helix domain-containing protein [Blastocatellia bacterium]|nr:winged helix-turn-helix domain-containing protein [Blastocatellia bacterium]
MTKHGRATYEFGAFHLDAGERLLLHEGKPVQLAPKVFDTLVALVENSGRLVDKDELMSRLWPDTFVEEATLARNISDLRKALGESSGSVKYIETVPKAGYRFVARVTGQGDERETLILQRRTRSRVVVEEETGERIWLRSIAVLPFKSLTTGDTDDYLGLGMADALITRFSKIRRIRVRPTSAIARYSGLNCDPVAAGREMGVDSVLEGNIQRTNDRIRVTVQLVDIDDGASLWAEKFDERFTDIFSVEDSISEQVARALILELTTDERKLLRKRYTDNTDAYQLYLKGRYYWNKRTPEWLKKGLECFRQAIDIDPTYATAYAGLSDSYTLMGVFGSMTPNEAFSQAKAAAAMALRLDETLGEAQASRAHAMLHNWEWEAAEQGFLRAIELNPDYPSTHHWYSEYLLATGQLEASLAAAERARELDPLSLIINTHISDILFYARKYEESAAQCERVLEMDPTFFLARISLARSHVRLGRYEQALAEFRDVDEIAGDTAWGFWMVGEMYASWGKRDEASAILEGLIDSGKASVSPCGVAMIFAMVEGEHDKAFQWLERAYDIHDSEVFNLKVEPRFDSLRGDPRYQNLLRRVGLES